MFDNRIEIKLHGAEADQAFFASVPRVGDFVALRNSTLEQRVEKVVFKVVGEQESEIHVHLERSGRRVLRPTQTTVTKVKRVI
jgi:hypothetical protein